MNRIYFISAFFLLSLLWGCSADEESLLLDKDSSVDSRVEVAAGVLAPLPSLPSSRAISVDNDKKINDYVIWVFDNGVFKEAIRDTDTCKDKDGTNRKVVRITDSGTMYILLKEEYTDVRLMMIANVNVSSPAVGTTLTAAEGLLSTVTFSYDGKAGSLDNMPFYGINDKSFAVALGADGGTIQLIRAMARVDVIASDTDNHFELEEIFVYHANTEGTVRKAVTIPAGRGDEIIYGGFPFHEGGNYNATVFMPEIGGIADGTTGTKTFVILKGKYKSYTSDIWQPRYYRLDFIGSKTGSDGKPVYTVFDEIKRNHRYIFTIEYLSPTAGYPTIGEALSGDADNRIYTGFNMAVINQDELLSCTTDEQVYLAVSSDYIEATDAENTSGFSWAPLQILTNNPKGWLIDYLPDGITVTQHEWDASAGVGSITYLYVWIDKSKFPSGSEPKIYIFSGRIRKIITIRVP